MAVNLVTAQGYEALQSDLRDAERKRPEIKDRLEEARSRGDLSENAEYHAAREELALLESRIRELQDRIASSRVIDSETLPQDMVMVGRTAVCEDLSDGSEQRFKLVGDGENTGMEGETLVISTSSPIGESLFKARVGDQIVVKAPKGKMRFEIKQILG